MSRLVGIAILFFLVALSGCSSPDLRTTEERQVKLEVQVSSTARRLGKAQKTLRVATINLAHGRKESINQWFVSAAKTRENLDDIAAYLLAANVDVVALQEADGPSRWSGNFDHVLYLAQQARYPYHVYTEHEAQWMGHYGTAILSRWPISEGLGLTYAKSPPTTSKGFSLGSIQWQAGQEGLSEIDVVSVHLDFSRESVRKQQIDEMVEVLAKRARPLVIMGDFNSEWLAKEYLVQNSSDAKRLHVYDPGSLALDTYKDKRLDWILLSYPLVFDSYEVEQKMLSDHRIVVADISWSAPEGAQ